MEPSNQVGFVWGNQPSQPEEEIKSFDAPSVPIKPALGRGRGGSGSNRFEALGSDRASSNTSMKDPSQLRAEDTNEEE